MLLEEPGGSIDGSCKIEEEKNDAITERNLSIADLMQFPDASQTQIEYIYYLPISLQSQSGNTGNDQSASGNGNPETGKESKSLRKKDKDKHEGDEEYIE